MMLDTFKGKLLVAKPNVMKDPHFAKSVVYIYEQTEKVCIGLILNKPSYMNVGDIQTMRGALNSGASGHLYRGGPVSEQSLLLLHTNEWNSTNTIPIIRWSLRSYGNRFTYGSYFYCNRRWNPGRNIRNSNSECYSANII